MSNLLGAAEIREIAERIGVRPTKKLGQNFVVDANTCRKIVKSAGVIESDVALEIGPGLGSLTLAMLESAREVIAIEIDDRLALELPETVIRAFDINTGRIPSYMLKRMNRVCMTFYFGIGFMQISICNEFLNDKLGADMSISDSGIHAFNIRIMQIM